MYKLIFYAPKDSCEEVKQAVFASGAGKLGDYEWCSFETPGTGQFRPIGNANPHLGKVGELERVEELKVEVLCLEENVKEATKAMLAAHPYEEPAFEIVELANAKLGF